MEVKNLRIANKGNLKAFFDVQTSEGVLLKGFKLVEGTKGQFVAVPSEQDRNDKNKWWDRVIMTKEQLKELLKEAKRIYGDTHE